ncbi:MAG TPA: hypothetical protein VKA02_10585 [Candidatus Acidoferrum sp.]|nr:hypothetical protein [Candidatus Acidoferrum sp.]
MFQNEHELFWYAKRAGVTAFVLMLGALIFCGYGASVASGAPGKDNPDDFSRVFNHTYDEVFQASQDAIERIGWFITKADKDKGTITGYGMYGKNNNTFEIQIEAVSQKPETRAAIAMKTHLLVGVERRGLATKFFVELQKVLVTYK